MELKEGYKQTEAGVIPYDWEIKKLHQVAEFINGKAHEMFIDENGDYKVVNSKFVSSEGTIYKFSSKALCSLNVGDITLVMSDIPNGKALAKCFLIDQNNIYTLNQRICALTPFEDSPDYLLRALNRNKHFLAFDSGTGQTNLRRQDVLSCPVVLPSKSEQKAIANALCDAETYIKSLEILIEKKKNIKQGAMQQLLKPKKGWEIKTIKEVSTYRRGSFPQPYGLDKWYDDVSGFPFIQVFDVDDNKRLKNETKRYISKAAQQMSVFVKKGSIILTIQGSIGRIAITQYDAYVDRTLLIFETFKVPFNSFFFMISIWRIFEIEKELAPGGIIKTITKEALSSFKISYPNIIEQERIANILSDIDNEIFTLEEKLYKAKSIKQGMMQNLLTGKIRLV